MKAEVANEILGVHGPHKRIEAGKCFANTHVSYQFAGMNSELGIVKDSYGYED